MELIRHSFTYFLARGIPGIISISSIAVFTRLLNLEDYGAFILVIAGADLLDAIFLQWINWSLVRYLEKNKTETNLFFSTILMAFILSLIPAVIISVISVYFIEEFSLQLVGIGFLYFILNGWFEINLHRSRAELTPVKFGILDLLRSVLSFAFALLFIYIGLGAFGIFLGYIIGRWFPPLLLNRDNWKGVFPWKYNKPLLRKLLYFGIPLGVSVALAMVVNLSDRILIGIMLGTESAARYAAGYDIVYRILLTAMTVLNLAGYPLIVKALESGGKSEADKILSSYFMILVGISLAGFATFYLLRFDLVYVLLGADYREAGVLLMPWVAAAVILSGMRGFYFNYAFQLGEKTMYQIWVSIVPAIINLGLNLWLIPQQGIMGAIYASVIAFAVALLLSYFLGNRFFHMPVFDRELIKVFVICLVYSALLYISASFTGTTYMVIRIIVAGLIALLLIFAMDFLGLRRSLLNRLRKA